MTYSWSSVESTKC